MAPKEQRRVREVHSGMIWLSESRLSLSRVLSPPTYDRSERGSAELDGLDSTDFVRPRWAVIRANGTVARSKGLHPTTSFTRRLGVGHYQIAFDASVRNCAYAVTTTDSFAGQTGVQDAPFSTDVHVFTTDSAGTRADLPFHLVVAC